MKIYDYLEDNYNRQPVQVTDFAMQVKKLDNGSFHFWIRPAMTDGEELHFIVNKSGMTPIDPKRQF